jgi:hypothetical protein
LNARSRSGGGVRLASTFVDYSVSPITSTTTRTSHGFDARTLGYTLVMKRHDSPSRKGVASLLVFMALSGCGGAPTKGTAAHGFPNLDERELFQVGLFRAQRGDFFGAEQYLVAARLRGFDGAAATYWLIRVCVSAGRYHSALRHARHYLAQNPNSWQLRLVVASIHEALGELSEARHELEVVLRAEPARPLAHYRIGMLYRRIPSSQQRGLEHLRQYLRLDPTGPYAEKVRGELRHADLVDATTSLSIKEKP